MGTWMLGKEITIGSVHMAEGAVETVRDDVGLGPPPPKKHIAGEPADEASEQAALTAVIDAKAAVAPVPKMAGSLSYKPQPRDSDDAQSTDSAKPSDPSPMTGTNPAAETTATVDANPSGSTNPVGDSKPEAETKPQSVIETTVTSETKPSDDSKKSDESQSKGALKASVDEFSFQ
jgi:hypothetical protein